VTYPMTDGDLSVPGAQTVRGYSFLWGFLCLCDLMRHRHVLGAKAECGVFKSVAPSLPSNAMGAIGCQWQRGWLGVFVCFGG